MPVPDPIAPMKSANIYRAPMMKPPKAAATGTYLPRYLAIASSRLP